MSEERGMLAAYDSQLRLDAEAQGALACRLMHWYPREGVLVEAPTVPDGAGESPFLPVMTAVFAGEAGFISHGAPGRSGTPSLLREELARPGRMPALVRAAVGSVLDLAIESQAGREGAEPGGGLSGPDGDDVIRSASADQGSSSQAGAARESSPVPGGAPVRAPRRPLSTLEWKTRSHDGLTGLDEALQAEGFTRGEEESVMIGESAALAVDVALPDGVSLQRVRSVEDALALCIAAEDAFDGSAAEAPRRAADLMGRLARGHGTEAWMALAEGEVVSGGRLEPVPGTDFAGIWGGFTLEDWRGQGIYRAVTAQRARTALAHGISLIHSDSTDYSRPILERYGFVRVTGTTPFEIEFG